MHFIKLQNLFILFFLALFFVAGSVNSQEFTSSNYIVLDPVMNAGGYGSSANFQLLGVISQVSNGTSTSFSFGDNAGFLYFPFASTPVVSTTPGDSQVALSWTVSNGFLGWTASGYNVGQSTVSGGPYTYSSLGNVTSSTRSGLSNGTTYYFVIVAKDAYGNPIATSTQVSGVPVATIVTPPPPGGGGGGGIITQETGVIFSGKAYPSSKVSFLKDGQLALTTVANSSGNFETKISNLSSGDYTFSVYAEDKNGLRSSSFTFTTRITSKVMTRISGIFIAPTIALDRSEVKRGDNLVIYGQSAPVADVIISINADQEFFERVLSGQDGIYSRSFNTSVLKNGKYSVKAKATLGGETSYFSNTLDFLVGAKNLPIKTTNVTKCDLNVDNRCNLIDFSIAAYWYKKPLSPVFIIRERDHLNGDGKVDLVDFSVMAYYWTG
jgi:hypothetical protein